jgi:hypothetical protein
MLPDARALDVPTKPQISGTRVLQNLKLVVLKYYKTSYRLTWPRILITGTKVLLELVVLKYYKISYRLSWPRILAKAMALISSLLRQLRQYLYVCTSKLLLRQYLYFCTSKNS